MKHFLSPTDAESYIRAAGGNAGVSQAHLDTLLQLQFLTAPAAQRQHHAYDGGLVVHTAEVLDSALNFAIGTACGVRVLATAACFHDWLKIRDYEHNIVQGLRVFDDEHPGGWRYTDFASKIKHVAGSFAAWMQIASQTGESDAFADAVSHCILAHHGRKDWGSPVEPQTQEAWILHAADVLSASYGPGRLKA